MSAVESLRRLVTNTTLLSRAALLKALTGTDAARNYDEECGYPQALDAQKYRDMYDREGIAARVVEIYPQESWALQPEIYETEDLDFTTFETALKELDKKHNLFYYLQRVDEMSGIGSYGLLLFGIDDGATDLKTPVPGINTFTGEIEPNRTKNHKLLFLRVFDESLVRINKFEGNIQSPRYGQPESYMVKFADPERNVDGATTDSTEQEVHWTRVLHVADNRLNSEVFGRPRMQRDFNRLIDLCKKQLGGSAEMFWKGAFPGYSFEIPADTAAQVELDKESLKEEMFNYMNKLQRYLTAEGGTWKSLAPQVADPQPHFEVQVEAICISLGVPKRIFMGSEEARLASSQDIQTWNKRLRRRQLTYLTPQLVRPFVDRLMAFGVLPLVSEYFVDWKDLNTPTDADRANIAVKKVEAMVKYITGKVDS